MHWFIKLSLAILAVVTLYFFITYSLPKILPTKLIKNSTVSGLIFQNQVWEGTVRVSGDLWFVPGSTVIVRPGAEIVVAIKGDKFNLDYLPWHLKNGINTAEYYQGVKKGEPFWDEAQKVQIHFGEILILGTKDQPVILRSDSNLGSPYDFNSVSVKYGIISHLKASNYRRLEITDGVVVRDSSFSNTGECAICITNGKPTIVNNIFSQSLREYIWVKGASPKISDNFFMKSSGAGIRINPDRLGTVIISHNNFEMPNSYAIDFQTGDELEGGVLSFNTFSGSSTIKLSCDSKTEITQNSILGLVEFILPGCANSYTFGPNYWGTDNATAVLNEKIIKKENNFNVKIPTILTAPPSQIGRRI